jgi:hypothetical protein
MEMAAVDGMSGAGEESVVHTAAAPGRSRGGPPRGRRGLGTVQMTLSKAHEAIGEFFCAFSNLERELGEAIKVVLRLRDHPAADAIVGLVGDFTRKANIVREAVQGAKRPDGTDPDEKWKRDVDEMMKQILGCNNPHRRNLGARCGSRLRAAQGRRLASPARSEAALARALVRKL